MPPERTNLTRTDLAVSTDIYYSAFPEGRDIVHDLGNSHLELGWDNS